MIDLAVKYNVPTFVTDVQLPVYGWDYPLAGCTAGTAMYFHPWCACGCIWWRCPILMKQVRAELARAEAALNWSNEINAARDDVVELRKVSERDAVGSAPDITRHFIELRGIGIIDVKTLFGAESVRYTVCGFSYQTGRVGQRQRIWPSQPAWGIYRVSWNKIVCHISAYPSGT